MPYETADNYETGVETLEAEPFEFEGGSRDAGESPFDEVEEMEYATQLLEVTDEAELDQFIGDLFKKAASAVGRVIKSPIGQHLGGMVKGAIKKALPGVGAAVGGYLVPGAGAAVGSQLASKVGNLLGLELEGLSPEDQEFELAKQLVRLAGTAAKHAVSAASTGASPATIARQALTKAAGQYAPGLLRTLGRSIPGVGSLFESDPAGPFETDSPFNEVEETEFATQLLEVSDEAELDQFIGSLLKKAAKAVGGIVRGPLGQQIGGLVKGAIKKALPRVGSAIGGAIPGVGSALGSQLASQGGQSLGLELEGSTSEDQVLDLARRLVRLAGSAVQHAATTPDGAPAPTARNAVARAARRHIPGLLRSARGVAGASSEGQGHRSRGQEGRWVRRGGNIVLMGA